MAVTRRKKRLIRSRELRRRRRFWEAAIQKHYEQILKVARRYTNGDKARAEGLVQRVVIRVLSQCPKIIPEQAIIPYLNRAIRNCWIDNRPRREFVSIEQENDESAYSLDIPVHFETPKNVEQSEIAARVLQEMKPDAPELPRLLGLKLKGYTMAEIDAELGKDPGFAQLLWQGFKDKCQRLAAPCPGKMRRRSQSDAKSKNKDQRPAA